MDKSIKDCTFRDYLMELQVSDDPAQAMLDVKIAAKNPDRYRKQQQATAVSKEREVKQATDDPAQREKLMLIQKQKIAAMAKKQVDDKERKIKQTAGIQSDTNNHPVAGMA